MNTSSSSKNHRRVVENHHQDKGRSITGKSVSFHVPNKNPTNPSLLRRPKTDPNLLSSYHTSSYSSSSSSLDESKPRRLTKLLLNVNVQRSLGTVHVIMSEESTVGDLVAAVINKYAKEGRRPCLSTTNPCDFNLHYSQFTLESLGRDEKLITLGSRNFFMCPTRKNNVAASPAGVAESSSPISCSKQINKEPTETDLSWCKLIDFFILSL